MALTPQTGLWVLCSTHRCPVCLNHSQLDGLGRVSLRVRGVGHGELTLKKATKLGVLEGVHRPCTKALRLVSDLRSRGCCLLYAACMMHNRGGG